MSGFTFRETLVTMGVLIAGLLLTIALVLYNRRNVKEAAIMDFEYSCNQLRIRIETRLEQHAQLLRGGKGLFSVSDTVTVEEWHNFYLKTNIDEYLPGIQGFGYSLLIQPEELESHEAQFRIIYRDYKPDYKVYPEGKRDVYSSIIMLEPHNERNLVAIGYDMFSDPVRRKAMEIARDSNSAMLSGMVRLVQEIDEDVQPGVLMYIPDYKKNMPFSTVEERRKAIKGWIYSPYRMRDLMQGIRGTMSHYAEAPLHLSIYDDTVISEETLLYDSYDMDSIYIEKPNLSLTLPAEFRGKIWTLVFTGRKDELSIFHREQLFIMVTGIFITLLLFGLSLMQIRSNIRRNQIEALNRQLERLNSDKDRFIAILSHDLKSPFTSILGFLELLRNGIRRYSLEQIEDHVKTIHDAAKNTYRLLEDLLVWTRAHTDKLPFNPKMIPLEKIYDNVIQVLIPLAESKKINLEYKAENNIMIFADEDMLKTVLRNLISNAIKFTDHGSVTVNAFHENDGVTVSVADTGTGIRPEQQSSLFDITRILPTAGTKGEKGSGLGLVICREFVEIHGGEIGFTSEWGKGSDFRFHLPEQKQQG